MVKRAINITLEKWFLRIKDLLKNSINEIEISRIKLIFEIIISEKLSNVTLEDSITNIELGSQKIISYNPIVKYKIDWGDWWNVGLSIKIRKRISLRNQK